MTEGGWELAQINVARLVAPHGDPVVQEFFDELDRINALADDSPGFVWRLKEESGGVGGISPTSDEHLIVNLSVWQAPEPLFDFVYRSAHAPVMAKRRQWFMRSRAPYQALWWLPEGLRPTIEDGLARLQHLERSGPSSRAFTFKKIYPGPHEASHSKHGL